MRWRIHSTNDFKRFKFTNCFFDNALRCELQPDQMTMVPSEINRPGEPPILAIVLLEQAQANKSCHFLKLFLGGLK